MYTEGTLLCKFPMHKLYAIITRGMAGFSFSIFDIKNAKKIFKK